MASPVFRVAILTAGLLLSACVTRPGGVEVAERDQYESLNRGIYDFNRGLDKAAVKPITQGYRAVVPGVARLGISNALDNVDEPMSFFNALLQGKIKSAVRTADRFFINSTIGVAGLADPATKMGIHKQEEDFGQTLAAWGLGSGPYVMLPFFGPSTLRDTIGFVVDTITDPFGLFQKRTLKMSFTERLGVTAFEAIDLRSRLIDTADPLLENAIDEYAVVRSAYLQQRLTDIYDGDPPEDDFMPVFSDEQTSADDTAADTTGSADDNTAEEHPQGEMPVSETPPSTM